jgi:hypothetical protein
VSRAALCRRSLGALLLVALAAPSCVGRSRGGGDTGLRVAAITGAALARAPGAAGFTALRRDDAVPVGTEIKTSKDADVRLVAGAGRAIELGADSQATILAPARISLDTGRLLAEPGTGSGVAVESRGVAASVANGAARLERILGALRVGVYSGAARIELLGRGIDVPALRQVIVAGGIPLERDPRPLELNASDRWDRRLLGDVIDFDRELGQFGRGFDQAFAGRATAPAFYSGFVPLPNLAFVAPALPSFDASDVLIGLVYAASLAAQVRDAAAIPTLFAGLLDLRNRGATWGLIAKEHGLTLGQLLRAVLDAIRRGTAPAGGQQSGGGSAQGGGGGSTSPTPHPTTSPSPHPTPTPTASPTPPPPPPPCSVLDRLLGNCGGGQSSSSGGGSPGGSGGTGCSLLGILLDPNC